MHILFEGSVNVHLNIVALSVKTASDDLNAMNAIIYVVYAHILALKFSLSVLHFSPSWSQALSRSMDYVM